jgi:SAM-dependent methyltransferase
MDSPHLDEGRHRRALDALGRINSLSLSARQLWSDLRPAVTADSGRTRRVLDLACGGGDVALALERHARRDGVELQVLGCDASPVAVERARERAADAGSRARFFRRDVVREPLPGDLDFVCSTLFLHHLDEDDAVRLLRKMADAATRMLVVQDLERSRAGLVLASLGVHLLTRSRVARVDGPRSVRAAYTVREAAELARRAGLEARVRRCWPQRYSLVWEAA